VAIVDERRVGSLGRAVRFFPPQTVLELVETAASVAGQVELSEMLRATVKTGMQLTGARYGALGVLGEHGIVLDFVHSGFDPETAREIGHLPRGLGVLGTITREAETIRIDDIGEHPDAVGFPEGHPAMTSFLGCPVRVGEKVFGNLYLTDKPGGFTQDDEVIVEFLAVTAGTAVSTLRLQERLRRAALHEDRERIARDLHDSIIQDLFAVGLGLQSSAARVEQDPAGVQVQLDSAIDRLDDTIASLRRFIFDLRPPVWARPPLEHELRRLLSELASPHDVEIGIDFDLPDDVPDPAVVDDLLAVAKESVSNALRHSGATSIDIRLALEGDRVRISVSDNGSGFDTAAASSGFGLENMSERVDRVHGSMFIDSVPGRGTIVHASFPISVDP
jgi:signal transduction histidine kinase